MQVLVFLQYHLHLNLKYFGVEGGATCPRYCGLSLFEDLGYWVDFRSFPSQKGHSLLAHLGEG